MWYCNKINKSRLVNETVMLQFTRILLFAHLLCIVYNQLCANYLPIKLWLLPPYYYVVFNMVFGTLVNILWVLIMLKLLDLCRDRITDNRDLIEYSKLDKVGVKE